MDGQPSGGKVINLWSRPHEALGKWAAEGAHRLRQFC